MSYLAMSAAPIEFDSIDVKKRQNTQTNTNTKTQKYRESLNTDKVNSVLKSIHNRIQTDDDENELGNYATSGNNEAAKHSESFKPLNPYEFPSKPVSGKGEKEGMTNAGDVPQPIDKEELELSELQSNFMDEKERNEYYKQVGAKHMHSYPYTKNQPYTESQSQFHSRTNSNSSPSYSNGYSGYNDDTNKVLIEKLNYMINLLEEQQDQRTDNVTEEVVLYSFLGVFIIFVIDSFARVGKYVR